MKILFLPLIPCFLLASCMHEYRNSNSLEKRYSELKDLPNDTLVTVFQSCTECLDLVVVEGEVSLSDEFRYSFKTPVRDIKVCGNFPLDVIDMSSFNFKSGQHFKIIGRVIGVDSTAMGKAPLFYVEQYLSISSSVVSCVNH